ncbi:MAG: hypothetical protein BAJALOKI3v1_590004 [Promethearchaeota archaeon]|nr:MAG: hypothetical protein BAJALOKI3v1_590004 [Candidatus Lokiarchaeota archaeon]
MLGLIITSVSVSAIYKTGNWIKTRKQKKTSKIESELNIPLIKDTPLNEDSTKMIFSFNHWNEKK